MSTKIYWVLRSAKNKLVFFARKMCYTVMQKYDKRKTAIPFYKIVVRTIVRQAVKCLLLSGIVLICDAKILPWGWKCLFRCDVPAMDQGRIIDVLIGGIGIAGVILGLYCANIVSIFSSKYANAPTRLAQLFQRDVITNRCVRHIVNYIVFCVVLLGACLFGGPISYVSAFAFLVFTAYVIVLYTVTGNRTNQLSNTYQIANNIYPEISTALRRVSEKGFCAVETSFQHHFQKICSQGLDDCLSIALFNAENPVNQNAAMLSFMSDNLLLMELYWQAKMHIRYDSFWYRAKVQYPQWHLASDTEISIALKTGTTLQTKSEKDYWWFEDAIEKINQVGAQKLSRDKDFNRIIQHMNRIGELSTHAVGSGNICAWVQSLERLQLVYTSKCINSEEANDPQVIAAIYDSFVGAYIAVLIAIYSWFSTLNLQSLLTQSTQLPFSDKAAITYSFLFNNRRTDHLFHVIGVELDLEKKRLTPDWYIMQVVANGVACFFNDISKAISMLCSNILNMGKDLTEKKDFFSAAVVFAHSLEFAHKAESVLELLEQNGKILSTYHVDEKVVWEDLCLDGARRALESLQKEIPKYLTRCSGVFSLSHWDDRSTYPDILGLCYNHTCEALVEAIETDDFEMFKSIYPGFLTTMLLYQEYIRSDVIKLMEDHQAQAVFHVATAPIVEYAEISGLAILWGEFSGSTQWKTLVESELASFIEKDKDNTERLKTMIQMVSTRRHHMFAIGNRDILQTEWQQRITNMIRHSDFCHYEYIEFGQKALVTDSKILKAFCYLSFDDLGLLEDSAEIFYICCANKFLPAEYRYNSQSNWEEKLDEI